MVSQCTNPECKKPLTYLDNGRVIRMLQHKGAKTQIQHFWLCGDCYLNYDFCVSSGGEVSCMRRPTTQLPQKEYYSRPGFPI